MAVSFLVLCIRASFSLSFLRRKTSGGVVSLANRPLSAAALQTRQRPTERATRRSRSAAGLLVGRLRGRHQAARKIDFSLLSRVFFCLCVVVVEGEAAWRRARSDSSGDISLGPDRYSKFEKALDTRVLFYATSPGLGRGSLWARSRVPRNQNGQRGETGNPPRPVVP